MADQTSSKVRQRVLGLSQSSFNVAKNMFHDVTLDRYTGDPFKSLKKFHYQYDHVVAYMILQKAWFQDAVGILSSWDKCLNAGGHLHIMATDFEWLREVFMGTDPVPHVQNHIYGWGKEEPHHSIYSVADLRRISEMAGLTVVAANTQFYSVNADGVDLSAGMVYVSCRKRHPEDWKE